MILLGLTNIYDEFIDSSLKYKDIGLKLETLDKFIMSYDIKIGNDSHNHTYNGSDVIKEIINMTPQDFDGKPACIVHELAKIVYDELSAHRDSYSQKFTKYNNWGTVDSWINFMQEIMESCERYKLAFVTVS